MRKLKYKKNIKVVPNFLEYTGVHKNQKTELQLFVYNNDFLHENKDLKVKDLSSEIDLSKTNWLNLHGFNDNAMMLSIGNFLKIDNFLISDILNTTKRTKVEEFDDALFFNIKSLLPIENSENIDVEQISFVLKHGLLVSFQEKRSDFFTHIRERLRTHSGIVRGRKADYLLYLLLEAIIENFYITIENEEDKVEDLINFTKSDSGANSLLQIEKHRDNFNFFKKSIIPLRDSLYIIKSIKDDNVCNVITPENFSFFGRLHQKTLELLEQIEYDMTTLESASNFYFSNQSHKMNEVMKTLTVVSVFFMPLTFIVGVYGMNFDNMPELHWQYGYFIIVGFMVVLLLGMIIYFKKKNWY